MGRPIGRTTGISSDDLGSNEVTITLVSVGPYVLTQRTRGPANLRHVVNAAEDAFSPPTMTIRRLFGKRSADSDSSRTSSCQYAVGRSSAVTRFSSTQRRKSPTASDASSSRTTRAPPAIHVGKI